MHDKIWKRIMSLDREVTEIKTRMNLKPVKQKDRYSCPFCSSDLEKMFYFQGNKKPKHTGYTCMKCGISFKKGR